MESGDPSPEPSSGETPRVTGEALQPPAGEEGSAPARMEPETPLVVILGTSLTEGYGLAEPGRQAWPARLAAEAERRGQAIEVRNAGLSGETSAGALRRVGWVLDRPPALFVLETGANDGLRGLPTDELEGNLDAIFSEVRASAPDAHLALAGMEAPPNFGREYVDRYRAVFSRVAERWDATLIPFLLEGVAGDPALNQADGIHPTAEGHRVMAETAWEALGDLILTLEPGEEAVRP